MLVRPQTLSLITTHRCTAACDHCCFTCTPKVTKAIPIDRLFTLIDEASQIPSMRVVVFTGGECFLLGNHLNELIAHATRHGLVTRCVTNGYWARSEKAAKVRVEQLSTAGLREINFSTGTFHAKYVPPERIIYGAKACLQAGFMTLINAEISSASDFDVSIFTSNEELGPLISSGKLRFQRNVWIQNADGNGSAELIPGDQHSRFREDRKAGCGTVLNVLSVTPDQDLVACCGLHLEAIPDLHLGSVRDRSILDILTSTPDDFLKIWIHVDGPERILEFVKARVPDYELPLHSVHPCETCLHLYRDPVALETVREHYKEVEDDVIDRWLAGMAAEKLNDKLRHHNHSVENWHHEKTP